MCAGRPPYGKKLAQTLMLCERKRGADGEVTKHKGRYVVWGDTQTYMDDYFEVWAPVARYSTLRVFLAFCASRDLAMELMNVATAFLNGDVRRNYTFRNLVATSGGRRGRCAS